MPTAARRRKASAGEADRQRALVMGFLLDTVQNPGEKTEVRIKCADIVLDELKKTDGAGGTTVEVVLGACEELAK